MLIPTTKWIVVANRTGARIFETRGIGGELRLVMELDDPRGRLHDREFNSDRFGRSFGPGNLRHAHEPEEHPFERAAANFARRIADELSRARAAGRYDALMLVAEPKFLGILRASLDDPTQARFSGALEKDLIGLSAPRLRAHLEKSL